MSSQNNQNSSGLRHRPTYAFAGALLAVSLVAGCDEQGKFAFPSANAAKNSAQAAAPAGPTVERDIEAPEVFSVTDQGLWDYRPSLGGVWVAHPDVNDPERVIIRNQSNGKFVVGALFRRERDIPGPSLQISSDAAVALGILAGAPTKLNVTALRKVEEPASTGEAPNTAATVEPAPAVDAAPLDPVASSASAAIDAAAPTPAPNPNRPHRCKHPVCQNRSFRSAFSASRPTQTVQPNRCAARGLLPPSNRAKSTVKLSGVSLSAPQPPARSAPKSCLLSNRRASLMPMPFQAKP